MRFLASAACLTACLGLVGCLHRDDTRKESGDREAAARGETLTVGPGPQAEAAWVAENRIRLAEGRTVTLGAATNATLIATLAPLAVPNEAATAIAYNSWRGRRPTVRVRDLATRRDAVLDEGAHSVAWGGNGSFAYFKALRPDLRDPRRYLGHVVVRRSERAGAQAWTARPGRYVVAAWARGRVLFYRLGARFPDLLVLDRPGRQRVLARESALVALSPDGRRAFVSRYRESPPLVRVLEVATGAELARSRVPAHRARYVVESGSWVGERVFAATTTGLAIFRVARGTIALEQVVRGGSTFPLGLLEPRAAPDGRRVVAWGELQPLPRQPLPRAALVECDRVTLRCVRAAVGPSVAPPRPVYNPSRP